MQITITPAQSLIIRDFLSDLVNDRTLVVNGSKLSIQEGSISRVPEIIASRQNKMLGKDARVAKNLANKIAEASQVQEPDADEIEEMSGNSAGDGNGWSAGSVNVEGRVDSAAFEEDHTVKDLGVKGADDLPNRVRMAVLAIATGEYGAEAQRLAQLPNAHEGERATRWVARLRHKLASAQLSEPANALRLTA